MRTKIATTAVFCLVAATVATPVNAVPIDITTAWNGVGTFTADNADGYFAPENSFLGIGSGGNLGTLDILTGTTIDFGVDTDLSGVNAGAKLIIGFQGDGVVNVNAGARLNDVGNGTLGIGGALGSGTLNVNGGIVYQANTATDQSGGAFSIDSQPPATTAIVNITNGGAVIVDRVFDNSSTDPDSAFGLIPIGQSGTATFTVSGVGSTLIVTGEDEGIVTVGDGLRGAAVGSLIIEGGGTAIVGGQVAFNAEVFGQAGAEGSADSRKLAAR